MKVHPLRDQVLARRLRPPPTTSGGLLVPDSAKSPPMEATIVAVGAGKRLENGTRQAVGLHIGDTILVGKYAGIDLELDGDKLLIVNEEDVLAILDAKAP